jgi:hypothetical protein
MADFSKTQTLHVYICTLCPMSSGTELSAVVFGQHVHPTLIPVFSSSAGCLKDKVYSSNLRTEELKENIRREISNIPAENLQKVNQNLFRRCEKCLRVEGQYFQHHLCYVNRGKNFPSFQNLSACWVNRKIRMRFAANGLMTAAKRRAVEPVNKLKILLVLFEWLNQEAYDKWDMQYAWSTLYSVDTDSIVNSLPPTRKMNACMAKWIQFF